MRRIITVVIVAVALVAALSLTMTLLFSPRGGTVRIDDILAAYRQTARYDGVAITYPADGTLFPPELAAPPCFCWQDNRAKFSAWLVRIEFDTGAPPIHALTERPQWIPSPQQWRNIREQSLEQAAQVVVLGVDGRKGSRIRSGARITIRTSRDEVGAPLFYREVPLPFIDAVKDPSHIRWRFGSIASPQPPPIVLQNLPVCGNCHSFSEKGETLAMDVDYANSKGSYVITAVREEMALATSDIITWNDYRKEDGEQTFGLLSQISPDGRYVVSTVKDKSVFVPKPGLAFSQLFFPVKGILCVYDRQRGHFSPLPGADDPRLVQSNPTWSPDGKYIVFARTEAYDLKHTRGEGEVLLTREECKEFLADGKPFRFDLYKIPFNQGQGGVPEPIEGASNNGMSNYFARYSPDGRWIVFCKAESYMLLQPDSELYIIPAEGGPARRLRCNLSRMNSWHSWSPNGKWLVFASKAYSDYTQLCLTHMDDHGVSTPPVLLAHLTSPDRAANIPEFVDTSEEAIRTIREQFLDDYSYVRAGNAFFRQGETDCAIEEYRNALALNPNNVQAHNRMGFLLYNAKGAFEEGLAHMRKALELAPQDPRVHHHLGMALLHQRRCEEAVRHLSEALQRMPDGISEQYSATRMHFQLGRALLMLGRCESAAGHLSKSLSLDPNQPRVRYNLAAALAELGRRDESLQHYSQAIRQDPTVDTSPTLHHFLATGYLESRQFEKALQHEEKALALAEAQGDKPLATSLKKNIEFCKQLIEATRR